MGDTTKTPERRVPILDDLLEDAYVQLVVSLLVGIAMFAAFAWWASTVA